MDSKIAQGFEHMTGAVGIERQTPRSWVQCFNLLATCSTTRETKRQRDRRDKTTEELTDRKEKRKKERAIPGNEWRPRLHHDAFLRVDVFLLPRVHDMFLLKALQRKRLCFVGR